MEEVKLQSMQVCCTRWRDYATCKAKLQLKEGAQPRFFQLRTVPYALKEVSK